MHTLSAFLFISLNGYYKGPNGDLSWHRHGAEESAFSESAVGAGNTLLFGRVTYEMMASFWPTPMAMQQAPVVAEGMNKAEKIVFSRSLENASWNNTRIIRENMIEAIRSMKQTPGKNMTLLGSGSILTQFADAGIIDEYQFMIDPVALPKGSSIFDGIFHKLDLELISSRTFQSGTILLSYRPLNS